MKMTIPLATDSISRSPLRYGLFLIPLVLAAFALSPTVQAQLSPPPDGGYDGDNTAEGTDALFSLTTGPDNTAIGFDALFSNTTGDSNTAVGSQALLSNTTGVRNTANGYFALGSNTTGERNTATGRAAMVNNTIGNNNTADGHDALAVSADFDHLRAPVEGSRAIDRRPAHDAAHADRARLTRLEGVADATPHCWSHLIGGYSFPQAKLL